MALDKDEAQLEWQRNSLSWDPYKVQLKGLKPSSSAEAVTGYIHSLTSQARVQNVLICSENGSALVTFTEQQDFETLAQTMDSDEKGLEGCKLMVERVPYCTCVLVTGLSGNTSRDGLKFYFENPRNGCGEEPSKIELEADLGRAWVHFKNYSALEPLLNKDHKLDGADITIEPYYAFLGQERCINKIEVLPEVMAYIKKNYEKELQTVLDENALELKWVPNATSAFLMQRSSTVGDEKSSAGGNGVKKLQEFLEDFEHHTFSVEEDMFQEVTESLSNQTKENDPRKFVLSFNVPGFVVNIVGKRHFTEVKAKYFETFIKNITEDRRLRDSVMICTERDLSIGQLAVIKKYGLVDKLQGFYKYTAIDADVENGSVIISCPESKMQEVTANVLRFLAMVDKEVVRLSERILDVFLSPKGAEYLSNAFKKDSVIAVLMITDEQKGRNEALIFAQNSEHCKKAVELIHSIAKEKFIRLPDESMKVIRKREWKELLDKLEDEFVVQILLDKTHAQTLWISGVEEDVIKCYESVKEHLDKYTILKDFVETTHGNLTFLFKVWNGKVKQIEKELKGSFLKIKPNCKKMRIEISGNENGIKVGKERLMAYIEKICHDEVIVEKPGMTKFFKSDEGLQQIKHIERDTSCTIAVMEGSELASQNYLPSDDFIVICRKTTPEGKILSVCKDDLTKHPADVIVNAANEKLQHSGGLAGAIVRAGGQEIQDECDEYIRKNGSLRTGEVLVTASGELPCQRIIHAVGPRWSRAAKANHAKGQKTNEEKLLHSAITKSLWEAKDYHSIAIPAVSSGIFGFPVDLCARTIIQSTIYFFQSDPRCNLSDVRFTSNDDPTVNAFEAEINKSFGDRKDKTGSLAPSPKPEPEKTETFRVSTPAQPILNDSAFLTPEGISISVKVGDISKEHSDVLVNTTGKELNLQSNSCAKSFSTAAGPDLQRFCKEIAPVRVGNIGVTKPGNLNCKYVFHAVCDDWQNGSGTKVLSALLTKCLVEAERQGARSISIPAIGTGVLSFPRDVVAKTSFDEVINFSRKSQSSHLKEVSFVVYHGDQQTVQSFQHELAQRKPVFHTPRGAYGGQSTVQMVQDESAQTINVDHNLDENSTRSKVSNGDHPEVPTTVAVKPRKPKLFEVKIGKITVQVEKGDITHEKTDAIGMLSNPVLDFENQGPTWAAIMHSDGQRIIMNRRDIHYELPIPHGQCVVFQTENLGVGYLVICSTDDKKPSRFSQNLVACLKRAEKQEFKSISFPALGTGGLGLSSKECANYMISAAKKFSKTRPKSMKLIRIVVFQKDMIDDFVTAMRKYSDSGKSVWQVVKSGTTALKRKLRRKERKVNVGNAEMFLKVYAGSQSDLRKALSAINNIMTTKCVLKTIPQKEAILDIDEDNMNEIGLLERQLDCRINVEKEKCLIIVEGLSEDVLEAITAINEMLHRIVAAKYEREKAESIAKEVQWEYETDDVFTPYSVEANAKIETAFANNQKDVTFQEHGEEVTIDFASFVEKSTAEGVQSHTKVKRKDLTLGRIRVPDHWDAQPKSNTGVEIPIHLVELIRNCPEYQTVQNRFSQSCPNNDITKISRVQNPEQYKIYSIRKQKMDDKAGSNEKQLFHGTTAESCESINQNGFNRSYCGKNATVYGSGVYFAVNAKYSAQQTYSPPDRNGTRYMYLARVLTGDYTKGNSSMIVPPPKNPAQSNDTYDTVVDNPSNPSIFVVFYDGQAYPEYLIEFK